MKIPACDLEIEVEPSSIVMTESTGRVRIANPKMPADEEGFLVEWVPAGTDIEALMRRRVPIGQPERAAGMVAGMPARGFGWTDGVRDFWSWFVEDAKGRTIELTAFRAGLPPMSRKQSIEDVARDFARRIALVAT